MKCTHTGLPTTMCGHCNGSQALEREPFRGQAQDETPRYFKGRNKAEWRGIGRSLHVDATLADGAKALHHCTQDTLTRGSCVKPACFSKWAQENALRTMCEVAGRKR